MMTDAFDLGRFVDAQDPVYAQVCAELRADQKRSHWMWFVFPQVAGLGKSAMARRFEIRSRAEARAYVSHLIVGIRLLECTQAVLTHRDKSASDIFGSPDDLKFHSSMTLFEAIGGEAALQRPSINSTAESATQRRLPFYPHGRASGNRARLRKLWLDSFRHFLRKGRHVRPSFFSLAVGRLKPFDQRRAYDDLVLIKHGFEAFAVVSPPGVIEIRGHNFDNKDLFPHDFVFIFGLAGSGRPCERRGAAERVGWVALQTAIDFRIERLALVIVERQQDFDQVRLVHSRC
jgi:uncharacterized protein (DUF1810 family)